MHNAAAGAPEEQHATNLEEDAERVEGNDVLGRVAAGTKHSNVVLDAHLVVEHAVLEASEETDRAARRVDRLERMPVVHGLEGAKLARVQHRGELVYRHRPLNVCAGDGVAERELVVHRVQQEVTACVRSVEDHVEVRLEVRSEHLPRREVCLLEDARRVFLVRAHVVVAIEDEYRLFVEAQRVEHRPVVRLYAEVVDEVEHLVELQRAAVVHGEHVLEHVSLDVHVFAQLEDDVLDEAYVQEREVASVSCCAAAAYRDI